MHNESVLCGQLKLRIRIPLRIVMVYGVTEFSMYTEFIYLLFILGFRDTSPCHVIVLITTKHDTCYDTCYELRYKLSFIFSSIKLLLH